MTRAEPSDRKRGVMYHTTLVGGFALLASTMLSLGDLLSKDEIALRRADDLKNLLQQVIPSDTHDNDLLTDTMHIAPNKLTEKELVVYRARRKNTVQAVAYETSVPGYAGPIVLVMGVNRDGTILGVRTVSHAETPGLGDKIEINKSNWLLSFNGLSLSNPTAKGWAVKKDGGDFDQFTGATITPRRAINAVRRGLEFFEAQRSRLLNERSDPNHKVRGGAITATDDKQLSEFGPPVPAKPEDAVQSPVVLDSIPTRSAVTHADLNLSSSIEHNSNED